MIQLALERALIVFYTQANAHFFQANEKREKCCADEVNFHPWTFSSPQRKLSDFFPFDVFLGPENVPLLSLSLPARLALRSLLSKLHKAEVT